ncbi:MAG: IS5 family transposase [Candidatus Dormibacteraceae bacterium]
MTSAKDIRHHPRVSGFPLFEAEHNRRSVPRSSHALLSQRSAGGDSAPSATVLDAQSIKTSEGGQERESDMGKKTTGRKRHIIVDTLGLPLVVMVTPASVQDHPDGRNILRGRNILQRLTVRFPSITLVWADEGYANKIDNSLIHRAQEKLDLLLKIVKRSDDITGFQVLPRRWIVERTFGWLVGNRRLARDYERLTANSETMITTAMIRPTATRLASETCQWNNHTEPKAAHRLASQT